MKQIQTQAWPLLAVAFLAPIIGGQVSLDPLPLESGFLGAILGGPEAPLATRALLGSLVALALIFALVQKRVVQIPTLKVASLALFLPIAVGVSIAFSAFSYLSYVSWLTWVVYAVCLFASTATLGRRVGVKAFLWAAVLGGTATALKGVQEYAQFRAIEPGHRIFADWNNPNALAGMLSVLVPIALGLCMSSERLEALLSGVCASLMLFALVLTQSKGGLLVTGLASMTVLASAITWKGGSKSARILVPLALAGALTLASIQSNKAQSGSPIGRLIAAGTTQGQSAGFRTLLWKGTVELIKTRPQGWGAGTYRYESARPGLTEQTFHSHQTWLQLAAEGGVLSLLVLIALTSFWLRIFLSGAKKWPWPEAGWRAGLLGGCVAAAADGFVESNLVYFGTGIVIFLLLGAGLQLSSDGSAPEVAPRRLRYIAAIFVGLVPVMLIHTALVENAKSSALEAGLRHDLAAAQNAVRSARRLAPGDGEAQYLSASYDSASPQEQTSWLGSASTSAPNTKYLRAFARASQGLGRPFDAMVALNKALARDPNNLATLEQKYKFLLEDSNLDEAIVTARKLVAVEAQPYFAIRAIPELVPLETYDARVFVSEHTNEPKEKADLLLGALKGYANFLQNTTPMIKRMTGGDPAKAFLGHDKRESDEVLAKALAVAEKLRGIYRSSGDQAGVSSVDSLSSGLKVDWTSN